jgi:uncharacterized protein (DUF697 family)
MAATRYPNTRSLLAPHLRSLPDRAIESIVSAQGLEPAAAEDFWSDIGNVVSSALPVIGGAIGSVVAPGVGTAIGSGLGSLAGGALHSAIVGTPQPAAQPPAAPQYGAGYPYPPQASSQQAAAQLLQLLSQPQLLQALMQMMLGKAGSPTVPVPAAPTTSGLQNPLGLLAGLLPGGAQSSASSIPVSAFTNALSALATQASEAYNAERAVDPASPESRAQSLVEALQASNAGRGDAFARRNRRQRLAEVARALQTVGGSRAASLSS